MQTVNTCSQFTGYNRIIINKIKLGDQLLLENQLANTVEYLNFVVPRPDNPVRVMLVSITLYQV